MIELLVAMTLGLVLLFGIIQIFTGSRTTSRLADAQTRAQEAGRYATQLLAKELRMARSAGCIGLDRALGEDPSNPPFYTSACSLLDDVAGCKNNDSEDQIGAIGMNRAMGYAASRPQDWLADLPGNAGTGAQGAVAARWLRGDVFVAWGVAGAGYYTGTNATGSRTDDIRVLAPKTTVEDAGLRAGRLALISNCKQTEVFRITGLAVETAGSTSKLAHHEERDGSRVNKSNALVQPYNYSGSDSTITIRARVLPFDLKVFFICCVDQGQGTLQQGQGVAQCADSSTKYRPALCRWSASAGDTQVLVIDIADMRVTYDGWLDAAARDKRLSDVAGAGEITNAAWIAKHNQYWKRVDTIHIQLLATSTDELATRAERLYTTASNEDTLGYGLPADRRIYESFGFAIANRATSTWFIANE